MQDLELPRPVHTGLDAAANLYLLGVLFTVQANHGFSMQDVR